MCSLWTIVVKSHLTSFQLCFNIKHAEGFFFLLFMFRGPPFTFFQLDKNVISILYHSKLILIPRTFSGNHNHLPATFMGCHFKDVWIRHCISTHASMNLSILFTVKVNKEKEKAWSQNWPRILKIPESTLRLSDKLALCNVFMAAFIFYLKVIIYQRGTILHKSVVNAKYECQDFVNAGGQRAAENMFVLRDSRVLFQERSGTFVVSCLRDFIELIILIAVIHHFCFKHKLVFPHTVSSSNTFLWSLFCTFDLKKQCAAHKQNRCINIAVKLRPNSLTSYSAYD